ncbi:PEP-CTERM sorting domain-containing protein [Novosphingobium sp. M1R2S20]|uniref:PEP-CTERM sorting domain-containing protein n=1 Tax=Novosphingobium rhizovicinum TaxID=3228928 RepID=A0ABV3R7I5_9SPHN
MKKSAFSVFAVAMFSILSLSQPSAAAVTVIDGACRSVSAATGCLFAGNINTSAEGANSYLSAQDAYNLYNDTQLSAAPDIFLAPIIASDALNFADFGSITGGDTTGGTWTLNGFLANYIGVKAGSSFALYALPAPSSSGSWTTSDLPGIKNGRNAGKPQALSHIAFFGSATPVSAVPEASTWAMMIMGIGLLGFAARRGKPNATMARRLSM